MQLILIIALIALINGGAYAQTFPSGSDNVEINLDALKPMDDEYDPPSMFDAPLTNFKESNDILQKPGAEKPKPAPKQVKYFDPPPIPPKRPETLKASPDYIRALAAKNNNVKIKAEDKIADSIKADTSTYSNDIDADVMQMDAKSVLSSIEGNDLTEYSPYVEEQNSAQELEYHTKIKPSAITDQRIVYDIGEVALEKSAEEYLQSYVVPPLKQNAQLRLEIQSFASPNIEEKNPRRTALTRALNIRRYLETYGISKDRVTIRALGDQTEITPADRAELRFLPQ